MRKQTRPMEAFARPGVIASTEEQRKCVGERSKSRPSHKNKLERAFFCALKNDNLNPTLLIGDGVVFDVQDIKSMQKEAR